MTGLPIEEVLDDVEQALNQHGNVVVLAAPGAGKTTVLPGMVLDRGLSGPKQQIWVLEPRRLAARLAAERLSSLRTTKLGAEVGYQVRFENKTSSDTKIIFLTEGVLTRKLLSDPFLEDVDVVFLDEFHERSVHTDIAIAFLREIQQSVRPELKIVVMSATLDPGPIATYLGSCPVVQSKGRTYPIETRYLEKINDRTVSQSIVYGVKKLLKESPNDGDILAFLPGAADINQTQKMLENDLGDKIDILPLYSELSAQQQDRAVSQRTTGALRRVILATNVAESSLTIPGVKMVVDSGLAKVASYDSNRGIDHLELSKISKFSADQRAGRAGRQAPGVVFRLWTQAEQQQRVLAEKPEIHRMDLTSVVLQVASWSAIDPNDFAWFDLPISSKISQSIGLLRKLGALPSNSYKPTPLGQCLANLPVHPRMGCLLLFGQANGCLNEVSRLAAILSEKDIVAKDKNKSDQIGVSDVLHRLDLLEEFERGNRYGVDVSAAKLVLRASKQLQKLVSRHTTGVSKTQYYDKISALTFEELLLKALLVAYPDRVVRRKKESLQFAEGGQGYLDKYSIVKEANFMVAVRIDGRGQNAFVRWASTINESWLNPIVIEDKLYFDPKTEKVEAKEVKCFGRLELTSKPKTPSGENVSDVLFEAASGQIDKIFPISDEAQDFFNRWNFVRQACSELQWSQMGPDKRIDVLRYATLGLRSFAELMRLDWVSLLISNLDYNDQQKLEQLAPLKIKVPSGRLAKLSYKPEGPPVLSVRLQEVFGLYETPRVLNGRVPIKMELLAPNQRPVQVTQDLENFWKNTYSEVRKELRRRYPKHQWPENPADGIASTRVRPKNK